jgi:predicted nucleic acid-binding protein
MPAVIIADASCLILLEKIGELELLRQVFGQIVVTRTVAEEFGLPLPVWAAVQQPHDLTRLQLLELALDPGEASAIALALEQTNALLIIDKLRGRRTAKQLGLNITGTFGVLIEAKHRGVISAVKPLLTRIRQINFRLSEELETQVLKLAGEL